jgi:hypothetical protein
VPDTPTALTLTLTLSLVSASKTVRVPLLLRPALVSVSAVAALSVLASLMSGPSLVPVMVTVTRAWLSVPFPRRMA